MNEYKKQDNCSDDPTARENQNNSQLIQAIENNPEKVSEILSKLDESTEITLIKNLETKKSSILRGINSVFNVPIEEINQDLVIGQPSLLRKEFDNYLQVIDQSAEPIKEKQRKIETKIAYLKQQTEDGLNALMLAAKYSNDTFPHILSAMQSLSTEVQEEILGQCSKDGDNILYLTASKQIDNLPKILGILDSFSNKMVMKLFEQKKHLSTMTHLIIMCVEQNKRDTINLILNSILRLDKGEDLIQTIEDELREPIESMLFTSGTKNNENELGEPSSTENNLAIYTESLGIIQYYKNRREEECQKIMDIRTKFHALHDKLPSDLSPNNFNANKRLSIIKILIDYMSEIIEQVNNRDNFVNQILPLTVSLFKNSTEKEKRSLILHKARSMNILFITAWKNHEIISEIINSIKKLNLDEQAEILGHKDKHDNNALTYASTFNPAGLPAILSAIQNLEPNKQAEIIGHKDKHDNNALMYAAARNPAALPTIISAIQNLEPNKQAEILGHKNKYDNNALMYAAQHNPEGLPAILSAIQNLELEKQAEILGQKSKTGKNILIHAESKKPEVLPTIICAIQRLSSEKQTDILFPNIKLKQSTLDNYLKQKFDDLQLESNVALFLIKNEVRKLQNNENNKNAKLWAEAHSLQKFCENIIEDNTPQDLQQLKLQIDTMRKTWGARSSFLSHLDRFEHAIRLKIENNLDRTISELEGRYLPSAPPMTLIGSEKSMSNHSTETFSSSASLGSSIASDSDFYNDNWFSELETSTGQNLANNIATLRIAPLDRQAELFKTIKNNNALFKKINDFTKTNKLAKRDFMMTELAFIIKNLQAKYNDNQEVIGNTNKLHKDLLDLIHCELKFSDPNANVANKLTETRILWPMAINLRLTKLKKIVKLTKEQNNFFNILIDATDKPIPTQPIQTTVNNLKLPEKYNINNTIKNSSNPLVIKIKNKENIEDQDLSLQNLKNYDTNEKHYPFTLAIKTRCTELHKIVQAIKNLPETDRHYILACCNTKNLSLIDRSLNSMFQSNPLQTQRDLYLLELERLSISESEKAVRYKLFELYRTLNKQDLTTDDSKAAWIMAITKIQNDPLFANKTGPLFWCKSAINFVICLLGLTKNKTPEGYGVGLFKPNLNQLFVEMSKFPLQLKPK